jgi:hypothetical protein
MVAQEFDDLWTAQIIEVDFDFRRVHRLEAGSDAMTTTYRVIFRAGLWNIVKVNGASLHFSSNSGLPGQQESLHKFAFAANGHAGEFLEPFALGNFRFGVKPIRKQSKLIN